VGRRGRADTRRGVARWDHQLDAVVAVHRDAYAKACSKVTLVPLWQAGTSPLLLGYQTQRMMLGNRGG
jgi:hypothetical protein